MWTGNEFLAVGSTVQYSKDGLHWSEAKGYGWGNTFYNVMWNGKRFIAVGSNGAVIVSDDGLNWTAKDSGINDTITGIVYDHSKYVAVTRDGGIYISDDGEGWNAVQLNSDMDYFFQDVIWVNNMFIIVGSHILTSTDGVQWINRTLDSNSLNISSITWGDEKWNINRSIGDSPFNVMSDIAWDGTNFIALSENRKVFYSADGLIWTMNTPNIDDTVLVNSILWDGRRLIIAGGSGETNHPVRL